MIAKILLILLSVFFVFFVFYKINWGAPFYFHPDERNIASAVSQLRFPENLNPHFFAYGSFPIYLVYILGIVLNSLSKQTINTSVSFEQAIILGRILSAILTVALVFLIYKFSLKIAGEKAALFSFIFSLTSVAFLQYSHFGTFEIWLSFFSLFSAYFYFLFFEKRKKIFFAAASFLLGFVTALKLSSAVLIVVPLSIIAANFFISSRRKASIIETLKLLFILLYFFSLSYLISSPFNILDTKSFISSIEYESDVAAGSLSVFYTGYFYDKLPFIFQYQRILPFLINPVATALSIPAIFYSLYLLIKKKNLALGIIIISFLSIFLSSSVLFTKWTRYIVPAVPFLYILISVFMEKLFHRTKNPIFTAALIILAGINLIFAFSFVKTVRIDNDTRIQARDYANKNIPFDARILSEVYDMGIVPFNASHSQITLFNFYDLENNPNKPLELSATLNDIEYIILPSQRIYKTRILDKNHFPNGNKFYSDLSKGKLKFKKIYETPCDIFCKIVYLGDPVTSFEETVNVFDRPTVFIFKK